MHPKRDKPGAGDKGGVGGLRGVLALEPRPPKKKKRSVFDGNIDVNNG